MRAKDQLHPLLSELMISPHGLQILNNKQTQSGLLAGPFRLITLNSMRASDEIMDKQSRQILFDIDSAYQEFYKSLT
ncbi:hypothetical protein MJO28_001675 [Puccinia striiformis f. sp. tritici]|uniref:Uncharacterized protein n=1 Tax=Puccinia striiformis f. sp. tritici TaxID=168172 RepID=A0ACC0EVB3_9BASI|nr:hypothetical protein MJO28_001675 [Puccinia striiformis f. sp. tritici]KAI7965965.1 hypothetical protein MJO29_001713 [Puccinia striiformis f. sp. tritici]